MIKEVFKLYSCCIMVKGYKRSVIIDMQRSELFYIPCSMYYFIKKYENIDKKEIYKININYINVIDEYYEFLTENELGFWTTEPEKFPKINMDWDESDKETIRKYCKNHLENLAPDIEFLEQVGNYSTANGTRHGSC